MQFVNLKNTYQGTCLLCRKYHIFNLANAVGTGRQLFTGRIPADLYDRLLAEGAIQHIPLQMNGVSGTEVRITAQAMTILQQYFQCQPGTQHFEAGPTEAEFPNVDIFRNPFAAAGKC